ncbi:MAG TPA: hypothetical protein VMI06_10970 [Terriglobia bacterium]|nr:hypothetical protein [Terriglobia bacterium]
MIRGMARAVFECGGSPLWTRQAGSELPSGKREQAPALNIPDLDVALMPRQCPTYPFDRKMPLVKCKNPKYAEVTSLYSAAYGSTLKTRVEMSEQEKGQETLDGVY